MVRSQLEPEGEITPPGTPGSDYFLVQSPSCSNA